MINKFLLLLIGISATISAAAFSLVPEYGAPFSGFYAGLGIGAVQNQADVDVQVPTLYTLTLLTRGNLNQAASINPFQDSLLGAVDLGYGYLIPRSIVYLGIEGFANFANHDVSHNMFTSFLSPPGVEDSHGAALSTNTKVSLREFEYGADFKPGILLGQRALIYGRIGAVFNDLEVASANAFALIRFSPDTAVANSALLVNQSKNVAGLRLGIGAEAAVNPHLGIHVDYIHTDYGHISAQGTGNLNAFSSVSPFGPVMIPNGFVNQTKTDLSSQMVLVGLNYYFNPNICYDETSAIHSDYFDGFYTGIRAGGTLIEGDLASQSLTTFRFFNVPAVSLNNSQSAPVWESGAMGGIFVGYGASPNNWPVFLGVEAFAEANSRNSLTSHHQSNQFFQETNIDDANVTLFTNSSARLNSVDYGADLRPGLLLNNNTLLYGRIGIAWNELKVNSNNQLTFLNIVGGNLIANSFLPISQNKEILGLRLGAGLEEYLCKNISVNADYVYTNYGDQTVSAMGPTIGFTGIANQTQVNPFGFFNHTRVSDVATQAVTLGITYHFDTLIKVDIVKK